MSVPQKYSPESKRRHKIYTNYKLEVFAYRLNKLNTYITFDFYRCNKQENILLLMQGPVPMEDQRHHRPFLGESWTRDQWTADNGGGAGKIRT